MITFQEILRRMSLFWEQQGCIIHQGYDIEVGAGTFNPATFLRALGPEPYNAAYIEPSRRPTDGRYGENPNRLQHYFQYQVVLKPSPPNILDLYLKSLEAIGFNLAEHDIRFVHDDWEAPTLGAWGLGWEVWMDGMEVTQFTYFQCLGGINLKPVTGEITYGLERLTMYLQKVNNFFDIMWNDKLTYGDIYKRNEVEWSHYNFDHASTDMWFRHFDDYEHEAQKLMKANLSLPAYDFVMKASHAFNVLDARGAISVTERTGYISRIRDLARQIAESYVQSREELKHPLLKHAVPAKEEAPLAPIPAELLQAKPEQKSDFLLEIGSEELPATFVPIGCQNLKRSLETLFQKEGLAYDDLKIYGTPRRLAAYVKGLALGKPAQEQEKRGPAINQAFDEQGNATQIGKGFFSSLKKEPLSLQQIRTSKDPEISVRPVKDAEYLFAKITQPGKATAALLADQLPALILNIEFPKKMRWGDLDITFARPLQWIIALLDQHVVPFKVGNIVSGNTSQGHRQLCPQPFKISHAKDYEAELKKHFVMPDLEKRKQEITRQLDELEKSLQANIIERDRVIPQVLNLVEWPQVTAATFNPNFLRIPSEVLISEMVEHQKYFPVANPDGTLKNSFVITANTNPSEQIKEGNQRVLSARLSDGVFLYEQDLKEPLEAFNEKLKHVTFQKALGSVYDKVERLVQHIKVLQDTLKISSPEKAQRAALLSKADLASKMVYEFPELQGTIGRYYALAAHEDPEVAVAIEEQWMPRGENAPLPESETGFLLSLAEKIDNLIGCFCVDLKPTSSSDPYALRRQVLGIIKMLIQRKQFLPLMPLFRKCFAHFPKQYTDKQETTLKEIEAFFINRIKTVFQDYGFLKDEIEASISHNFSDIYDAFCRVKSLHEFRKSSPHFPLLFEVYKRAKGQVENQQKYDFSASLLQEPAEKVLHEALSKSEEVFPMAIKHQEYGKAYSLLAQLQPALAGLFDNVKVLADDEKVRHNRIALLQIVFGRFAQLLDFSKIQ